MNRNIADVLDLFLKARLKTVHTCIPGRVLSFEKSTRKASVEPLIKTLSLDGTVLELPVIDNVPVYFPSSNSFSLTFEVKNGDGCLILFSEEGMGEFLRSRAKTEPDGCARFSLTDAICLPGLWSFKSVPANQAIIDVETANKMTISTQKSGKIVIQDDTVTINDGTKGAGRVDDATVSDNSTDPTLWNWLSGLMAAITAWVPVPADGGAALKAAILAYVSEPPTSSTGKINAGSTKVKIG